ncbi:MAG: hypothetical protein PW843_01615 [Azospirillaceae bacterium]|nr:hypothetical protein [Azospirillaceae bacterium]
MSIAAALVQSLPLMALQAPVELAGMALMAHAMGRAARRDGQALLANPFLDDVDDGADAPTMAAWRDGWLNGG